MTEVSFYILDNAAPNAAPHFACRLTEKAQAAGHRLYLHTADAVQAAALDHMLWTFRHGSFVPHVVRADLAADDNLTPVVVGTGEPPPGFDDILVNVDGDVSRFFSRFQRHMEVVPPTRRAAARDAYRFYRDRGYALQTHHIKR